MLAVQLAKVSKEFAGTLIFDEIDLEIMDGERVGLVGENGSGKSTMLKLIAGLENPTEGALTRRRNLTVGYLRQEVDPRQLHKTVYEAVAELSPELSVLASRLHDLEAAMSHPDAAGDPDEMDRVLTEYGEVQERFESLGGYAMEHQVESVLEGLGIKPSQYGQQVGTLSGGEKKLVNLARLLLDKPDLLLLDEPDNHLDLEAKAWLEDFIRNYPGTVLIISHDRFLLDRVAKKIFELQDGTIEAYAGNYTFYVHERQMRLEQRHEMYTLQQEEMKRLEALVRQFKGWAKMNSKFAARATSLEKRLERAREEAAERPVMLRERIKLNFDSDRSGKKVLEVKGLMKRMGERTLFRPFDATIMYGDRVGIVGPNGSGKTTLLRTITGAIPPDGGTVKIGASVVLGYYAQEQDTLPLDSTPLDYVRGLKPMTEQHGIGLLRRLLFTYREMHNPIRHMSGGEKSRLQIARLMLTDANFLVLDEPTNNLDLPSIEVLEAALEQFEGTLLAVSHDRYFLDRIVTRTLAIDGGRVREYPGNFSYYLDKRDRQPEVAMRGR